MNEVSLRPLRRDDFVQLGAWLEAPHVARWWVHETTTDALERDFGDAIDGREPTDCFIAAARSQAFGLIQRYPIAAYAGYAAELGAVVALPVGAWGIDYEGTPRTVDTFVRQLRQKLEPDPEEPRYILTARGLGYRFERPQS